MGEIILKDDRDWIADQFESAAWILKNQPVTKNKSQEEIVKALEELAIKFNSEGN
jgi:hypothetical protein